MSGTEEEWVKAAMTNDTMVVELLVRLHAAAPPPTPPFKRPTLPLEWSVRQRRSKPVFANTNQKKQSQSQRASPTTPLSWSGATSFSGGSGGAGGVGGGSEESSRPHIQKLPRSKVNGDNEKPASKRSRKKKTLAELKDDENSLLKERRELKREISALRLNLVKQRAKNENLKRMKIELCLPDKEITSITEESISDQPEPKSCLQSSSSIGFPDPAFALPDLNIPFEDEPYPDPIHGVKLNHDQSLNLFSC